MIAWDWAHSVEMVHVEMFVWAVPQPAMNGGAGPRPEMFRPPPPHGMPPNPMMGGGMGGPMMGRRVPCPCAVPIFNAAELQSEAEQLRAAFASHHRRRKVPDVSCSLSRIRSSSV